MTYEAYKHTPGTFQSLREVKIDVQKCIGTMTMSLNAVLGRFLGIHDRGDRPIQRVSKHTLMQSETQPASGVSINH